MQRNRIRSLFFSYHSALLKGRDYATPDFQDYWRGYIVLGQDDDDDDDVGFLLPSPSATMQVG